MIESALPEHAEVVDCQKHIEALFAEVNALSMQLKQSARSASLSDSILAGNASVLQVIEKLGPLTVPQIARVRLTSRQNIQVLVNRLIADGCLEANTNPKHKRSVVFGLTPEGKKLLATAANHETQIVKHLSARVSAKKVSEAVELLQQLRSCLTQENNGQEKNGRSRTVHIPSEREVTPSAASAVHREAEVEELPVSLL
jgi:DNA-binding MarR family transcriptional regulator